MNRNEAKQLADTATPEQLRQMFLNAQERITDWRQVSRVNKSMSKGTAFNILSAGSLDVKTFASKIAVTNMIWEFGEYLPGYTKPLAKERTEISVHHQEPKFLPPNPSPTPIKK